MKVSSSSTIRGRGYKVGSHFMVQDAGDAIGPDVGVLQGAVQPKGVLSGFRPVALHVRTLPHHPCTGNKRIHILTH